MRLRFLPKRDPIDYVNHLRLEIDSRNPRTRLAILGMMSEAKQELTPETLETAKAAAEWVGDGVDQLLTDYLEDTLRNEADEEEEDSPHSEEKAREGYKYL